MKECRPKALAVYQAVLKLLDEGADVSSMTVSEVAERAGIGKGTVYGYFASKEEMVAGAIFYEIERLTEELQEILDQADTFEKKIYRLFDSMERGLEENFRFSRFMRLACHTSEIGQPFCREIERRGKETEHARGVLLGLYEAAAAEGLVRREGIPQTAAFMTVTTRLLMYMIYLENRGEIQDMDDKMMRRFLYRSMLADWNQEM